MNSSPMKRYQWRIWATGPLAPPLCLNAKKFF